MSTLVAGIEFDPRGVLIPSRRSMQAAHRQQAERYGRDNATPRCAFVRGASPSHIRRRRGGTIIDFAAAAWGLGTREQDFLGVRRRLASTFGIPPRPDAGA